MVTLPVIDMNRPRHYCQQPRYDRSLHWFGYWLVSVGSAWRYGGVMQAEAATLPPPPPESSAMVMQSELAGAIYSRLRQSSICYIEQAAERKECSMLVYE